MEHEVKVIVIGAGAAGLAACNRLLEAGISEFLLLEARSRIGGRIHSVLNGSNGFLELGANWIHGEEGNAVFSIAKMENLLSEPNPIFENFSSDMFVCESCDLPSDIGKKLLFLTHELDRDVDPMIDDNCHGTSLGDSLSRKFEQMIQNENWNIGEWKQPFKNWIHRYMNSLESSDDWLEVSNKKTFKWCKGNPMVHFNPSLGYQSLINYFQRTIPQDKICLDKEVIGVKWQPNRDGHLKVCCSDGSCYMGSWIILTLPLGVLKRGMWDLFDPPLPEKKMQAIQHLGYGTVNKIFIAFHQRWWPEKCGGFNILWKDEALPSSLPDENEPPPFRKLMQRPPTAV